MTAWVARPARDVVVVTGADARSFLQSLVSQDLDAIAAGGGARSLLLAPQGKLIAEFVALCVADDEWWLVTEGGFGETLAAGLNRFRIRVKVEIRVAEELAVAEVRGTLVDGAPEVQYDHAIAPDGLRVVRHDWAGTVGVDLIGASAAVDARDGALGVAALDGDAYERARIAAGVVRFGLDIDDATIAQEAHLEADAVSFTKGCFVGQELVCRIDSRGHVNRFLRRLFLDAPSEAAVAGAEVTLDGKVVGAVTSAPNGADLVLAIVRREIEPGARVEVAGVGARVEALTPSAAAPA